MTIFNDFLHFFFNILGNKHPNNTSTGKGLSQMNFLEHENVETHPPWAGILCNKHFHTRSENKEFTTYFHSLYENVQREQSPKGGPPSAIWAFFVGVCPRR